MKPWDIVKILPEEDGGDLRSAMVLEANESWAWVLVDGETWPRDLPINQLLRPETVGGLLYL